MMAGTEISSPVTGPSGNLDRAALTQHVLAFVAPIGGAVLNVKMCPTGSLTTAHAIVEFGPLHMTPRPRSASPGTSCWAEA
ncbi:Uncharacterized protein PBTT_01926 [Plasmodiophora brassicae]